MPASRLPIPTPEERAARLLAAEREATRVVRRRFGAAVVLCFLWMTVGLALMGWSMTTTDQRLAGVAFWAGILIGDVGILASLLYTYRRAEDEGLI
jgi:hypothetical protein